MAVLEIEPEALSLWAEEAPEQTLDDVLSGAWQALATGASVACPVCHGQMAPRWSAGAGVVGGRCADCGAELG
jgi:hypothetical protein